MAKRFSYEYGPVDPETERRIARIVDEDRARRDEPTLGPAVITRRATPDELARFDQRHGGEPTKALISGTPRSIVPPTGLKPEGTAVKDTAPIRSFDAKPTAAIEGLLADGFSVADGERNRLKAARPMISCRPSVTIQLNRYAVEAMGPFEHLFLLVDKANRRLAIVVGTPEQAVAVGVAPRRSKPCVSSATVYAREEMTELGLIGKVSRQFRPSRVEHGLIVISADDDELATP